MAAKHHSSSFVQRGSNTVDLGVLSTSTFGDTRDVYGRLLAYIWVGKGFHELFNETLLQKGYARTTRFSHDLQREFKRVEREAKEEKRGLWGAC